MKTSKTLSTVSYNTKDFLVFKLDDLLKRQIIDFWIFGEHLPEEDEKKKHKHLFWIPKVEIDTIRFEKEFEEFDPQKPLKPLKCIETKKSDFGNWYFYFLHDKKYLATKGQARKHSYSDEDLIYSDEEYFVRLKHTIDLTRVYKDSKIYEFLEHHAKNNTPWNEVFRLGMVPLRHFQTCRDIYESFKEDNLLNRAGRKGHEEQQEINMEEGKNNG